MMEGLSLLLVGGVFCAGFAYMLSWCINEWLYLNDEENEEDDEDYEEIDIF